MRDTKMTTSLQNNRLSTAGNFNQGGNGKYKPLRRKNSNGQNSSSAAYDPFNPVYNRMSFKSTKDPVYIAFEHIEKQSPLKLTTDLIKDGIKASINTIGKTVVTLFN